MLVASWSAWSSLCLRMDEMRTESLWVRIKERADKGDIILRVCYRPPDQGDRVGQALYKQMKAATHSQDLVLMGDFNHPLIFWKDNTAGHKQPRRFLEGTDELIPRDRGAKEVKYCAGICPQKQGGHGGECET